ncbi:MAG: hypothetical protein ABL908_13550 [Hyphomicrobium sp.]
MADESNKPHFTVHCVGKRDGREFWTRVGVAWKNPKATDTISLVLNGITVSGKVVLLPHVEQEDEKAEEKPAKAKRSEKAA